MLPLLLRTSEARQLQESNRGGCSKRGAPATQAVGGLGTLSAYTVLNAQGSLAQHAFSVVPAWLAVGAGPDL